MGLSNLKTALTFAALYNKTIADGQVASCNYSKSFVSKPSDADILFNNGYTIAGSGNQILDLSGSLLDGIGQAAVFATLYAIMILNLNAITGNYVTITSTIPFLSGTSPEITIGPSGCLFVSSPVDGYTVTDTSADSITIDNPGASSIDVVVACLGK